MRLRLLVLPLLLVAVPARAATSSSHSAGVPARAAVAAPTDTAATIAAGLSGGPVYQARGLDLIDGAALTAELAGTDPQVDVAVVPAGSASAAQVVTAIGDPQLVVLVITADQQLSAAAGVDAIGRGVDASAALKEQLAAAPAPPFDQVQLTALAGAFAERVAGQVSGDGPDPTRTVPPAATSTPSATAAPPASAAPASRSSSSHTPWFVGSGLLLGLVLAAAIVWRRRHP